MQDFGLPQRDIDRCPCTSCSVGQETADDPSDEPHNSAQRSSDNSARSNDDSGQFCLTFAEKPAIIVDAESQVEAGLYFLSMFQSTTRPVFGTKGVSRSSR